jgi:hypothetical protein
MSQLQERTLLFKGTTNTANDADANSKDIFVIGTNDLTATDAGAPWEIQIKSALGSAATSAIAAGADSGITEAEAQIMGNLIHRLLKNYMEAAPGTATNYDKTKIQNVRLNVTLKE